MQSRLDVSLDAEDSSIVIIRNETRMSLTEFLNIAGDVYRFGQTIIPKQKLIVEQSPEALE